MKHELKLQLMKESCNLQCGNNLACSPGSLVASSYFALEDKLTYFAKNFQVYCDAFFMFLTEADKNPGKVLALSPPLLGSSCTSGGRKIF